MSVPQQPIPRPPAARWKDIRIRHFPMLTYLVGVGLIVYLWNAHWMPSSFTGEAQARTATVISPMNGLLVEMSVGAFDRVEQGQVLGKVVLAPETMQAQMGRARAELNVMRVRMIVDERRAANDYHRLRLEQLDQQVDLAIARSRLRYAEHELARQEELRRDQIQSVGDYEIALDNRDALLAEIKQREALIQTVEVALQPVRSEADGGGDALVGAAIREAIQAQAAEIEQAGELMLRAPISGVVTRLSRRNGEFVTAGEALLVVSSERTENIVGYVRQPIGFEPRVGERVLVRTRRGNTRRAAEAQILAIGGRLEFFSQPLRVRGFDSSQERGLPVLISAPEILALHPGELVDLALLD